MKIKVEPGATTRTASRPEGGDAVPEGFMQALQQLTCFVGRHSKAFPSGQFLYLFDGSLYASNNRHIVERKLNGLLGARARLTLQDVALLRAMGTDPDRLIISKGEIVFTWQDGRWLRFKSETANFHMVESCRKWLLKYWAESPAILLLNSDVVDRVMEQAPEHLPAPFTFHDGRGLAMASGFFFRAEQRPIEDLVDEERIDPRIDDLFAAAISETKSDQTLNNTRIGRLIAKLSSIKAEIKCLEESNAAFAERLDKQHAAIAKYQTGDELDEVERALLSPRCDKLVQGDKKEETEVEFDHHVDKLPQDWEVTGKRIDKDYIYITIRHAREVVSASKVAVKQKVEKALDRFFAPDFDRQSRIRWDQLGTLSPIIPGAP